MSRLDANVFILELIKKQDYKKLFIDNIDKIISQYSCSDFVETLKLAELGKLIELRIFFSKIFFDLFNLKDDLCLKFRRGDNANTAICNDVYILAHCIVDKKNF